MFLIKKHTSTAIWVKEKPEEELEDLPSDQPKLKTYQIPEDPTKGYTMLNLGVNYHNTRGNVDYTVSLNANNLLNQKCIFTIRICLMCHRWGVM